MTEPRKPRRTFTPEFKHQLVQLHKNGKRKCDITKEYDVIKNSVTVIVRIDYKIPK